MKSLVLLIGDGGVAPWSEHSEEEKREVMGRFAAFAEPCAAHDGVELLQVLPPYDIRVHPTLEVAP